MQDEKKMFAGDGLNQWFKLFSFLYLGLPVVMFVSTWLRFPYNVLTVLLIIIVFTLYLRSLHLDLRFDAGKSKILILFAAYSLLFAALSGAGSYVFQKPDWTKHNVILNDLINYDWPVYYGKSFFVENTSLVYYIAYYLPAAFVGKFFGWGAAQFALFIYTAFGIFIFGVLARSILRNHSKWLFPAFFFLSGLDIVGAFLMHSWFGGLMHIESYVGGLQFSSMMTILTWVPQHGISAWIPTVLFYISEKKWVTKFGPFYIAFAFFWSPFVALGLAIMWIQFFEWRSLFGKHFIFNAGASSILILIAMLYYKSQLPLGESKIALYLFAVKPILLAIRNQALFLSLDLFFIVVIFLLLRNHIMKKDKFIFYSSIVILVLLSQVMYGQNNDFVMRVTIPHLSLIFLLALKYLPDLIKLKKIFIIIAVYILIVGSITSYIEMTQLFSHSHFGANERPIYDLMLSHKRYGVSHQQYMGLATKAFGRLIGNYEKYIK